MLQIVTKQSQSLTLKLYKDRGHGVKSAGSLTVHAEETALSKTSVELVFRCSNLDNKEIFSKSVWTMSHQQLKFGFQNYFSDYYLLFVRTHF